MDVERMDDRKKVLNYLGMDFDYSIKGEVSISMRYCENNIISELLNPLRDKAILKPSKAKLYEARPCVLIRSRSYIG